MLIYILLFFLTCLDLNAGEETFSHFNKDFESTCPNEKIEIKLLFKDLFFNQGLAYSLFGDKPLSFSDETLFKYTSDKLIELFSIDGYCQTIMEPYCEPSSIFEKRWKILNKYRSNFDFKNYALFVKKIDEKPRIVIINKQKFIEIVNKNINLFQKITVSTFTAKEILYKIINEDKSMLEILNKNVGLLGILLGFGTHNAMLFQKREEILHTLNMPLYDSKFLNEELEEINERLKALHEYDPHIIASANRVGFVADPNHPETIQLRNEYDELNNKINEIYSKDDWFEQTLIQLTSE